ncbi:unnamed protein product [Nezara viridula]|uniref:Epidermal cell surface receptor n=1 Tax=Nezara viridula TaxID=85310 RepID=A0A9P0EDJ0_NEZVI|nr:unnamed protein product [Nezara viridula]
MDLRPPCIATITVFFAISSLAQDIQPNASTVATTLAQEIQNVSALLPTVIPGMVYNVTSSPTSGTKEGRALANLTESALDDVTMDEDAQCHEGETKEHGCDEICQCNNGRMECRPRCTGPLVRSTLSSPDPNCFLKQENECCSKMICSHSNEENEPEIQSCTHNNQTYKKGEQFNVECTICECTDNGAVQCKPRCPPTTNNTNSDSDRCLTVPDKKDPCCTILYCDVNESEDGLDEDSDDFVELNLVSAVPANNSAVILNFDSLTVPDHIQAEISQDKSTWLIAKTSGHIVQDLKPGNTYYFRVVSASGVSNIVSSTLPKLSVNSSLCEYKGKTYKKGVEFHDGCTAYCMCAEEGVECAAIECPTDFGLDVLDPQCLKWENRPVDFKPTPPRCCPDSVVCVNNGSCVYKGETFENWSDIPTKLSGCEMKCYCQAGNVNCMPRCPPIPATPPQDMHCASNAVPIVAHPPDDNCCLHWMCPSSNGVSQQYHPQDFGNHPSHEKNSITVHALEAIDENTVRLVFSVPMILVGLHGRVELRYTADNKNSDPDTWEQQVLAPPDDIIATPELEFKLEGLTANTEYKIKITVVMRDLDNSPVSQILTVKTPPASFSTPTLPPAIPVDPDLHVVDVNSTSATLSWRKFAEKELQFIDGVQLRYKEIEGKVYQATPLIHRAVTSYTIEDLKPESQYEVGMLLIPFPGQTTELQSQKTVHISTTMENDPYKFELVLDMHHIKSTSVEVSWSGVPYPEDKYVNIFRAIYQYEGGREDMNSFKVAKRDSPSGTLIQGLKPDTRYRLWIEAYLTNGKIKKSNVKDFITKKGSGSSVDITQGKFEGASLAEVNDYYGPLVGVSILAAIAILVAVGLLVILARKHGHNKAPITTAVQRKPLPHTAAYDNPSYKTCESGSSNGGRSSHTFENA